MTRGWTLEQEVLFSVNELGQLKLPQVAVHADAGAGKTSVLVKRITEIISHSRISKLNNFKILCVSFTEKSKADLESRLNIFSEVEVYTIHGFCARIVQEFGSYLNFPLVMKVMSGEDSQELFYESFEKIFRNYPPSKLQHPVSTFFNACRTAYDTGLRPEDCIRTENIDEKVIWDEFISRVFTDFRENKLKKFCLDYADLELFAVLLLQNKPVQEKLKARYSHLFIDEFQDTSELQCELVKKILHPKSSLFVVGDLKQSIYRFRGADVSVFENFSNSLPAHKNLSVNFRSHQDVIESVNRVGVRSILNYQPMQVGLLTSQISTFEKFNLPRVAKITSDSDAKGVHNILNKLKSIDVDPSQVVLLLRRIRGREKFFQELDALGVGYTVANSRTTMADPVYGSLIHLWIWSLEPWQKQRAFQVFVDFELKSNQFNYEMLLGMKETPYCSGMSCEDLLSALDSRFKLSEFFGVQFAQFKVFVIDHQIQGYTPARLAQKLNRISNDFDNGIFEGLKSIPVPPEIQGALRVMTVHASKGLEFPVVILADLDRARSRVGDGAVVRSGQEVWLASRNEDFDLVKGDDFKQAIESEKLHESAEQARLLYVAMTRAQEALYTVNRPKNDEINKSSYENWSHWLDEGITTKLHIDEYKSEVLNASHEQAPVQKSDQLKFIEPIYKPARIGVTEYLDSTRQKEVLAHQSYVYPDEFYSECGTAIHKFLEFSDWDGLKEYENNVLTNKNFNISRFWNWLKTVEALNIFGLHSDSRRVETEYPIEFYRDDQVLTGRIDRLIEFSQENEVWIIDYKLVFKKKSINELKNEYKAQLLIYHDALVQLFPNRKIRIFLIDVLASSGQILCEI